MKSVLCIDDDLVIQTLVLECLGHYSVQVAGSVKAALELLEKETFDAILLDIQLQDDDGLRILERVSKRDGFFQNTALFILSSHKDISKKMMAFSLGADDFISKPFDPLELEIRLNARLKKLVSSNENKFLGDLVFDYGRQKVFLNREGQKLDLSLTSIEFKVLNYLVSKLDRVFSRQQIIDNVWMDHSITERTVDSHIANLRKKLLDSNLRIVTSNTIGYFASLNQS